MLSARRLKHAVVVAAAAEVSAVVVPPQQLGNAQLGCRFDAVGVEAASCEPHRVAQPRQQLEAVGLVAEQ
jgi:hypothetical protein